MTNMSEQCGVSTYMRLTRFLYEVLLRGINT